MCDKDPVVASERSARDGYLPRRRAGRGRGVAPLWGQREVGLEVVVLRIVAELELF